MASSHPCLRSMRRLPLSPLLLLLVTLGLVHTPLRYDGISVGTGVAAATSLAEITRREYVLRSHMSTKTMYPAPPFQKTKRESKKENDTIPATHVAHDGASCRAVQLNYVIRHGTRFPTVKDIRRIAATHARLHASSPSRALASNGRVGWVRTWENPYAESRAGWLAAAGVAELIAMGQRVRARFGVALPGHFDARAFTFEHTYKPRTRQSALAFAHGLFGGVQPVHYASAPVGQDQQLRFFDNCPRFTSSIDANKSATAEHAAYRSSAQMRTNLRRFRKRAAGNAELTQQDLEAAHAACAFDVAVLGRFSDWCALFDEDMLYSMDYFHDLKHFYKKSHGNALAFEIAAPLLQDVVRSMRTRVRHEPRDGDGSDQGDRPVQGHFRFAHAETILPLASLLNLSYFDRHASDRDGHFLAETPLEIARQRAFRGSTLAPFAANVGFVLYECTNTESHQRSNDGSKPPPLSSFRVETLLHERTVGFPECDGLALCPFERFERMFAQWIHEYDFFSQCAV